MPSFEQLNDYRKAEKVTAKGKLCVVLVVTRIAKENDFPLNEEDFITGGEGQVRGLGKTAVQTILADYGITKVLAEEGGRTSRGSLGLMKSYVAFLNKFATKGDLDAIEKWWVDRVSEFFSSKPFKLAIDSSKTVTSSFQGLIKQAEARQKENKSKTYVGAVFQHLVGAKISVAIPDITIDMNGYSVADAVSARSGDFQVSDTVIHVTTMPSEGLIRKCIRNIEGSLKPIIITGKRGFSVAESLLEDAQIRDRVDVYEITQFLSINVNEVGKFTTENKKETIISIAEKYNDIIDLVESDPSLRIDID